jgi:hypothetical protein
MTSNRKLNLEGSYAVNVMLPGRSKIWKISLFGFSGSHQVHIIFQPSPHLSPSVATPAKVSTASAAKIMFYIAFIFVLIKLLNKLISKQRYFRK